MKEATKRKIDEAVEIIESCWEENNPNSNKTFDEMLDERIRDEEDDVVGQILIKAKRGV